jgi:hypothetical protein
LQTSDKKEIILIISKMNKFFNTDESHYVKLVLLKNFLISHFKLSAFNLIYSSYLKFRCTKYRFNKCQEILREKRNIHKITSCTFICHLLSQISMCRNFGYLEVAFQFLIYNSEAIKQPAVYSNITHFVAKKTEKIPIRK